MRFPFFSYGILFYFICGLSSSLIAQQNPPVSDSLNIEKVIKGSEIDTSAKVKPTRVLRFTDSAYAKIAPKLDDALTTLSSFSVRLSKPLDTTQLSQDLSDLEIRIKKSLEYLKDKAQASGLRTLNTMKGVLTQSEGELTNWQETISLKNEELVEISVALAKMANDTSFNELPSDSLLLQQYLTQIKEVEKRFRIVETARKDQQLGLDLLALRISNAQIQLTDANQQLQKLIITANRNVFSAEEPPIYRIGKQERLAKSLDYHRKTIRRLFLFTWSYIVEEIGLLILACLVVLLFYGWTKRNMQRFVANRSPKDYGPIHYLDESQFLSAVSIVVISLPYLLPNPPTLLVEFFWLISLLALTGIIWNEWPTSLRNMWLVNLLLFTVYGFDFLIYEHSIEERWILLILGIGALIWGIYLIKQVNLLTTPLKRSIKFTAYFFITMQAIALLCNITGRVTLTKLFSMAAIVGLNFAIAFHIVVLLIIESFYLQIEANKQSRFSSYFNFNELKDKLQGILKLIAIVSWCLSIAWSLGFYDSVISGFSNFLKKERNLGSYGFTFGSIAIFLVVIYISNVLAKILTVFYGGGQQTIGGARPKVGSWVLLARLGIYSVGFLIAMAAAGIPLDKLAIVIGALGVGIGFGLQNIVNNLVSGIIMVFEKPMEIGDVIEVGTRMGTVKEIGIRSSKISTYDGSEIIVPNGDFISQQLINWTHSNNYRRIELMIGVAYKADLSKVQDVLNNVIGQMQGIASNPGFSVLVHNFDASSVTFRVLFWTSDFDNSVTLKSNVLQAIFEAFRTHKIEIPFPQQDVYIKEFPKT